MLDAMILDYMLARAPVMLVALTAAAVLAAALAAVWRSRRRPR